MEAKDETMDTEKLDETLTYFSRVMQCCSDLEKLSDLIGACDADKVFGVHKVMAFRCLDECEASIRNIKNRQEVRDQKLEESLKRTIFGLPGFAGTSKNTEGGVQ